MTIPTMRATAAAVLLSFPVSAQAGNEVIFVGTSTSGSTDFHALVASGNGNVLFQGPSAFTDNVTDAVWADTGRNLYVAQGLQNRVARGAWNGASASWSTFYQPASPGPCYGLGLDAGRARLWVLTGTGASTRELHCVDADPGSPGYGTLVAATSTLSGASRERWELSPSGNLAVVPHAFINTGLFEIVDTNPNSATFLQIIVSTSLPGASAGGFAIASDAAVRADDQFAYVLYTGIGASSGLAVYSLQAQSWVDFSATPGQQDIGVPLVAPNRMDLSPDGSFALISGQGSGGWVMRVDFDYVAPANTTAAQLPGLFIPNANGVSLSPDGARAAVTSTPQSVAPPGTLVVFDPASGAVLQSVPVSSLWNIYTTAWQDASPTATYEPFGAGCAGTLGVPTLAAAPGSRPALGSTLAVLADRLPFGIAVLQLGLSNTVTSGSLPLPLSLGSIGMTNCSLLVDPAVSFALVAAGTSATWSWPLPATQSLFGARFYSQAFPLDPAANSFGFTASNGTIGTIGL